jgi:pyruvate/2-oxoglutarate dehydrogenase complex dihydrolipoamide acyltransferase (E2) component
MVMTFVGRTWHARAEVMIDKVTVEVPAPHAGVVRLLAPEGAAVRQGVPIARVG